MDCGQAGEFAFGVLYVGDGEVGVEDCGVVGGKEEGSEGAFVVVCCCVELESEAGLEGGVPWVRRGCGRFRLGRQ